MRRVLTHLALFSLALSHGACGGSGSNSEPLTPTQRFDGPYFLASLSPDGDAVYSSSTHLSAHGNGRVDVSVSWLTGEGSSSTPFGDPIDTPYTVADDLSFSLAGFPGRMSSDGRAFTLSVAPTVSSTSIAAFGLRARQLSSLDPLLGNWRSVSIRRGTDDDPHMIATTGFASIENDGGYTLANFLTSRNEDGTLTPFGLIAGLEGIELLGETRFRVNSPGAGTHYGSLSQDGDVIMLWGRLDDPHYTSLRFLVREGSIGQLSGTYSVTGLRSATDALVLRTQGTLTMTSSSAGQLEEGGIDASGRAAATATRTGQDLDVTFDGEIDGSQTVRGFVNRAGTFGVLCGPITAGDRPHIRFLVK